MLKWEREITEDKSKQQFNLYCDGILIAYVYCIINFHSMADTWYLCFDKYIVTLKSTRIPNIKKEAISLIKERIRVNIKEEIAIIKRLRKDIKIRHNKLRRLRQIQRKIKER